MPGKLMTPPVIDVGGVVKLSVGFLRQGAANEIDAKLGRQRGERLLGRPSLRLAICVKTFVVVWTAEHLRQDANVNAPPAAA